MAVPLGTHFFTGASIPFRTELSISLYATQNQWVTATVVREERVTRKSKSAVGGRRSGEWRVAPRRSGETRGERGSAAPKAGRVAERTARNHRGQGGGTPRVVFFALAAACSL